MTLKTLTMARNGGLVIASAVLMGEPISGLEAFGYTGLLSCFAMYTYVKAQEGTVPMPHKVTVASDQGFLNSASPVERKDLLSTQEDDEESNE